MDKSLITLRVELHQPQKVDAINASNAEMKGYYINLGVSAFSQAEGLKMAKSFITDGIVVDSETSIKGLEECHESIQLIAEEINSPEIWYRSGRIFFP